MQLETERLILREFIEADWPDVLAYQADPRFRGFYPWTQRTEQDARAFVGMFLAQQAERPRRKYQLALVLKSEGRVIGNCGIRSDDFGTGEANLGYEIAPRLWGRGLATEAAREVLRFGFGTLGMRRVWAWCVAENAASVRVLEKLGMRQEGRLREKELIRGRWHDHLLFAILAREWAALDASAPAARTDSAVKEPAAG